MVQIYLLSVIAGVAGGCLLLSEQLKEKVPPLTVFREWYRKNQAYQPFIFCLFCIIGLLSLVFPFNGVVILGDFIPGLANLFIGVALFFEYYKDKGKVVSESLGKAISFFDQYQGALGAVSLIAGAAHFIFPGILFI